MKKIILFFYGCILFFNSIGQVAINTDASTAHGSAMLDIKSNNKGLLPPRMTWQQIQSIQNPAAGLVVFDEGLRALRLYDGLNWIVLGAKEYELSDPPGNFSTSTVPSTNPNFYTTPGSLAIGNNKRVATIISHIGTLFLGADTFGIINTVGSTLACFSESGSYLWGFGLTGIGNYFYDVTIDPAGNLFVTGGFSGTIDLDFGAGSDLHNSATSTVFFAKYNQNGDFIWGKNLASTNFSESVDIVYDEIGNCFITGPFSGTLDTDPGVGVQNLVSAGSNDIFFAKYDNGGNWVWSKRLGGTLGDVVRSLRLLNGTVLLTGDFTGTADFDPSAGTLNLVSAGGTDFFIARYDGAGNILWAKRIGGTGNEQGSSIAIDPSGNFVFTGNFNSAILDIDPDGGVLNFGTAGANDIMVAKYTGTGALVPGWHFKLGTLDAQWNSKVETDSAGNVYLTGYFAQSFDFDPGAGAVFLNSAGGIDAYLAKYTVDGAFVFAKSIQGISTDQGWDLAVHPNGKLLYVNGFTLSSPWLSFNRLRFYDIGFNLTRYEE